METRMETSEELLDLHYEIDKVIQKYVDIIEDLKDTITELKGKIEGLERELEEQDT